MSLYDDLDGVPMQTPASDDSGELSGWSSSLKLMQTQLQRKRVVQNKPVPVQKSTVVNSVILDRGLKRANEELEDTRPVVNTDSFISHSFQSNENDEPFIETVASMLDVVDEYDPLKPNDYETVKEKHRELREKEKRESRERERNSRDSERDRDRDSYRERDRDFDRSYNRDRDYERDRERDRDRERRRDRQRSNDDDDESSHRRSAKRTGGAAIAPPTFLTEESNPVPQQQEEVLEAQIERRPFQSLVNPEKPNVGFNSPIASQIMAKYGWKDGQGLGKSEQGINTCLQVEKTSKRGGKIINKDKETKEQEPDSIVNTLRNPSKVVLLRNMVGPGEVDDDLQPETAEECAKYGEVSKVIIYEIPSGVAHEEAVRIFVEFQRVESAIKAVVDLNGRFFGGRTVKATFYNLDKFRRLDLADDL